MASSGPSSDRPTTPSGSSDRHPLSHTGSGTSLVQIGHYVLGETLGIGTFGKVKGNLKIDRECSKYVHLYSLIISTYQ